MKIINIGSIKIVRIGVDLSNTKLIGADLSHSKFFSSNLTGVDLSFANLNYTNFHYTDLEKAIIKYEQDKISYDSKFYDAKFDFAINVPYMNIPMACPEKGSFIAWKKVFDDVTLKWYIVKLEIPEDAKRSSATTYKCRCDKAKVLGIYSSYGILSSVNRIVNSNYSTMEYIVGKMVYPDSFDEDRWNECSHGIHFFMDRDMALNY